jgi:hypothetical protein
MPSACASPSQSGPEQLPSAGGVPGEPGQGDQRGVVETESGTGGEATPGLVGVAGHELRKEIGGKSGRGGNEEGGPRKPGNRL